MNDQLSLGLERKEAGQRTALSHAEQWAESVVKFVSALPRGIEVDAEYIREVCGAPSSMNAMGGIFSRMAKQGLIRSDGRRKAHRASRHANEIRVWKRL